MAKRTFEQDGFTVVVTHEIDDNPDLSYLTQEYADESPEDREAYKEQDKSRLEAYDRQEWYYIGVCVSILKQTKTNWANGGLEVGRASAWGIESDSDQSYIDTVESEEITEAFNEVQRLRTVLCSANQPQETN